MRSAQNVADQSEFYKTREAAADIHAIRVSGLYVENDATGLSIPSEAISPERFRASMFIRIL